VSLDSREARLERSDSGARTPLLPSLLRLVLGLALVWLGGFLYFVGDLPRREPDSARHTDAIVVLTGGADRLDTGLALLLQGRAERLLVSGVDRATTETALLARTNVAPEKFACCVELGHDAADTDGNAVEAALWMRQAGYTSLRLVTASYHMPRALLLFQHQMPEIEIVENPVFPSHVRVDDWWRWPNTARLLAGEFNKYLVSLLRVRLAGGG
jgi:uncharacterized SAM-binding protein YcdF (DUF218 family)